MSYTPTESWLIDWCNKYATPVMQQCDHPESQPIVLAFMLPALAAAIDARDPADDEAAATELAELKSRLPAEMEGQRIVLNRCRVGHAWMVGANWVDHGCPWCKVAALEAKVAELRAEIERVSA